MLRGHEGGMKNLHALLIALFLLPACTTPESHAMEKPLNGQAIIIAHRGASFDAPENTLAAFRLGYEQGADAGELDIHLSQDGRIVVHHDADTGRTVLLNFKNRDREHLARVMAAAMLRAVGR